MNEKYLIKRAKKGDVECFGMLYEQVYKKLYQFALYTLKNKEDAEDVVSETVMDAFATINKLKNEEAFNYWIFQILSNKCKRKMKDYYIQRNEVSINDENYVEEVGEVSFEIPDQASRIDIRNKLMELNGEDRIIISMHLILGYTTKEIAISLNMNENTVRSKEARCIKKIRQELGGAENE